MNKYKIRIIDETKLDRAISKGARTVRDIAAYPFGKLGEAIEGAYKDLIGEKTGDVQAQTIPSEMPPYAFQSGHFISPVSREAKKIARKVPRK